MPDNKEEISLRDIIIKIKNWLKYLISKWKILFIALIFGSVIGLGYSFLKKPEYIASLTFVMENTKSNGLSAYAGLASQFGLDMGNLSGSGVFDGDNILQFLQSRLLVVQTLMTDTICEGKVMTLADMYINTYNWKDKWKQKPDLQAFSFPLNSSAKNLNRLQDSVMYLLYKAIIQNNLNVIKPDKKLGFIYVSTVTTNETFSKLFTERLVNAAVSFYVDTRTQRSRNNVSRFQSQADSVLTLLDKKTYAAALNQDINLNPAKRVASIGTEETSRDKVILTTMYGEVVKNLEIAKMTLLEETPIIQVVDAPVFPLEIKKVGHLSGIFWGGALGALVAAFCIFLISVYRTIMA